MNRSKTLSLPLITALVAATAVSASAQLAFEVSSQKTYRQDKDSIKFQGGKFEVNLTDGKIVYIAGCDFFQYIPPGYYVGICGLGTNGRVISGNVGGASRANPYLLVTSIVPALVVEPRQPKLVTLIAAPASGLARPQGGFADNSVALYYNLHALQQREYVVSRYELSKNYNKNQGAKFEEDIVTGSYRYSFPRLGQPNIPAPINAQINPMPEGLNKKNNVTSGFEFTTVNDDKWTKDGFVELSFANPNPIKWRPLSPNSVFVRADSLSFSIRVLKDQKNPRSGTDLIDNYSGKQQSVFPDYSSDGDPKLLLTNPFTGTFVLPPIFAGGTRGMVEVQVQRALSTSGVSYDLSTRKFQIPIVVVNKFSEYQESTFLKKGAKKNLLDDSDGDGFNNLNEWILDSNGADSESTPRQPVPAAVESAYDLDYLAFFSRVRLVRGQYFGFTITKKLGTQPAVTETLQRSKDGGKTWGDFKSGYYFLDGSYSKTYDGPIRGNLIKWIVKTVKLAPGVGSLRENSPRREEIRVESGYYDNTNVFEYVQPPGSEKETFRVKVTLKK